MTLAPLVSASPIILAHAAAALVAVALGATIMLARKGTPRHRLMGQAWCGLMAFVALSSFAIVNVNHGHFSPIHLLSILTLVTIPTAIAARRRGNIRRHAISMSILFASLLIAGAFTLLPSRILGQALFG